MMVGRFFHFLVELKMKIPMRVILNVVTSAKKYFWTHHAIRSMTCY